MHKLGSLFIIAAPSGAGKTTLVSELIDFIDGVVVSVSHTTRPARPSEHNGVNYHFVSDDEFTKMENQNLFLEYANVFEYRYGTSKKWVEEQLQKGNDVILEIDWQGARQIKQHNPDAVGIFILPPSHASLLERLQKRAQDNPEVIKTRMAKANEELVHYHEFDYLVVNEFFDDALEDLAAIIRTHRLTLAKQLQCHQKLLQELLD